MLCARNAACIFKQIDPSRTSTESVTLLDLQNENSSGLPTPGGVSAITDCHTPSVEVRALCLTGIGRTVV
jgi:hypothetical protein